MKKRIFLDFISMGICFGIFGQNQKNDGLIVSQVMGMSLNELQRYLSIRLENQGNGSYMTTANYPDRLSISEFKIDNTIGVYQWTYVYFVDKEIYKEKQQGVLNTHFDILKKHFTDTYGSPAIDSPDCIWLSGLPDECRMLKLQKTNDMVGVFWIGSKLPR
jgi:hypothetical protein